MDPGSRSAIALRFHLEVPKACHGIGLGPEADVPLNRRVGGVVD